MSNVPVIAFTPKTKSQRIAERDFQSKDVNFFLGPPGSGKSFCALALALREVVHGTSKKKRIIYCRPMVEAGNTIGFLPGDLDEKYAPYLDAVGPLLSKMVFRLPPDTIVYKPLTFLRSQTFDDCIAVLDEAQNATRSQIKLFMTRMGQNCKMIIVGDPFQADIKATVSGYSSDLDFVADQLEDLPEVSILEFEGNLRHKLVSQFADRL